MTRGSRVALSIFVGLSLTTAFSALGAITVQGRTAAPNEIAATLDAPTSAVDLPISAQPDGLQTTAPGRQFFDEHMAYLFAGDIDGMIDNQYTQDAVLISPFDLLDSPPPHIVRGNQALKDFFHRYMEWQGDIDVEDVYDFAETENSIAFQAIFTSKTGRWVVGDAWHMTGGKIDTHYSFAHRLGDARR